MRPFVILMLLLTVTIYVQGSLYDQVLDDFERVNLPVNKTREIWTNLIEKKNTSRSFINTTNIILKTLIYWNKIFLGEKHN